MPGWSIGPIVGQYQPEDFTEKQSVKYEEPPTFGIVPPLIFMGWGLREITLSFVVNSMGVPNSERVRNPKIPNAPDQSDPEVVWAMLCAMMRPGFGPGGGLFSRSPIPPVLGGIEDGYNFPRVLIPGWNVNGANGPFNAVVVDASIKRTHLAGYGLSRAVRAVITVTLRELRPDVLLSRNAEGAEERLSQSRFGGGT